MNCAKCGLAKLSVEYASLPTGSDAEVRRQCKRTCLSCLLSQPDALPVGIDQGLLKQQLQLTSKWTEFEKFVAEAKEVKPSAKHVCVRSVTGQVAQVELPASGTVRDLKSAVAKMMKVSKRGMRLIIDGKELKGRRGTLAQLGVVAGSQIRLIIAFSKFAGQNRIVGAARDNHGNAAGSEYDLTVDGAFDGMTVAVLHLYTGEDFNFGHPEQALRQKGFQVHRWIGGGIGDTTTGVPSPAELEAVLMRDDVTQVS